MFNFLIFVCINLVSTTFKGSSIIIFIEYYLWEENYSWASLWCQMLFQTCIYIVLWVHLHLARAFEHSQVIQNNTGLYWYPVDYLLLTNEINGPEAKLWMWEWGSVYKAWFRWLRIIQWSSRVYYKTLFILWIQQFKVEQPVIFREQTSYIGLSQAACTAMQTCVLCTII